MKRRRSNAPASEPEISFGVRCGKKGSYSLDGLASGTDVVPNLQWSAISTNVWDDKNERLKV